MLLEIREKHYTEDQVLIKNLIYYVFFQFQL